jgi:hypothetical protein
VVQCPRRFCRQWNLFVHHTGENLQARTLAVEDYDKARPMESLGRGLVVAGVPYDDAANLVRAAEGRARDFA